MRSSGSPTGTRTPAASTPSSTATPALSPNTPTPTTRQQIAAAARAGEDKDTAWQAYQHAHQRYERALHHRGNLGRVDDPATKLARVEDAIAADQDELAAARARITTLQADPTLRAQPHEVIDHARADWAAARDSDQDYHAELLALQAILERQPAHAAAWRRDPWRSATPAMPGVASTDRDGPGISV